MIFISKGDKKLIKLKYVCNIIFKDFLFNKKWYKFYIDCIYDLFFKEFSYWFFGRWFYLVKYGFVNIIDMLI